MLDNPENEALNCFKYSFFENWLDNLKYLNSVVWLGSSIIQTKFLEGS